MTIGRRGFVAGALGLGVAAVVGTSVLSRGGFGGGVLVANAAGGGHGRYHLGPRNRPKAAAHAMQQRADGRWASHLMPFTSFPTMAALEKAEARARLRGLIG